MGVAHLQFDGAALDADAVAHADDFQGLLEALGDAEDAVVEQGAAQAVLGWMRRLLTLVL